MALNDIPPGEVPATPSREFYNCVAYLVEVGHAKVTLAVPTSTKDFLMEHARRTLGPGIAVRDVARWDLGAEDPGKFRLVFEKVQR